jgi:hypothetical protein
MGIEIEDGGRYNDGIDGIQSRWWKREICMKTMVLYNSWREKEEV